jgi:hypothetical protein
MKTVAYSCPFVPPEWIAAHGLRPRLLVPASLGTGAESGPTAGLCAFARAAAQAAVEDGAIDAYVATSLCDQRRRATELAARHSKKPVFMLHVRRPAARQAPRRCTSPNFSGWAGSWFAWAEKSPRGMS